jgi:hypothetical protein
MANKHGGDARTTFFDFDISGGQSGNSVPGLSLLRED